MRGGEACVLALLCACLGGCFWGENARSGDWVNPANLPRTTLGTDGVLLDIVLVQRPLGDPLLNEEVWLTSDCQVAGLEKKVLLDDNGFRVGQVIGMNPARLQGCIDNERYHASRIRQILAAGKTVTVPLGPAVDQCSFWVNEGHGKAEVALPQGACVLAIVPSLTNDGRTRLKFTPQVFYGSVMPERQVAPDRRGWELEYKRQSKSYDALSWEVTLAPNQYLVIGTHFDENAPEEMSQSLGNQCFLVEKGAGLAQRALVIRTTRGAEKN